MINIKRVFIANRGEIARRIAIGAQSLGIEVATIYSGEAPPAFLEGLVQHFVHVAEESPAVYLDASLMVQLAQQSGCDAVHPGFGFLSENAGFAHLVEKSGLTWIGPTPASIEAVASKAAARELAHLHQVPTVPGLEKLPISADGSHLALVKGFIREYGFPVLLKASMGGGGKGMRVVRHESELDEAIHRAQSEALNAFGDAALILERYVEHPRHVEVQILGDAHGHIYALGDRDCSVQRRHQKIIEEAPAPGLSEATRRRMQQAAIRLAQAVQYRSAGTVEFLVDWSPELRERDEQKFYFLEMNTRLQVEHPVTEQIFNEDLVVWQFRVARGESIEGRLSTQPQGHSIELRLYAEDAAKNFLPAPGPVYGFLPVHLPGIRWEIGIDQLDTITARFDPMIAKLVATAPTRDMAIDRLIKALQQTVLALPVSNIAFLLSVLHHPGFTETQPTTRFIADHLDQLQEWIAAARSNWEEKAKALLRDITYLAPAAPLQAPSALTQLTQRVFKSQKSQAKGPAFHLSACTLAEVPRRFPQRQSQLGRGLFAEGDHWQAFTFCQGPWEGGRIQWLAIQGHAFLTKTVPDDGLSSARGSHDSHVISAPVPGKVVKVLIDEGSVVQERQVVLILESMKMEFEVQASRAGRVRAVLVQAGQQVQADELLAHWQIEEAEGTGPA